MRHSMFRSVAIQPRSGSTRSWRLHPYRITLPPPPRYSGRVIARAARATGHELRWRAGAIDPKRVLRRRVFQLDLESFSQQYDPYVYMSIVFLFAFLCCSSCFLLFLVFSAHVVDEPPGTKQEIPPPFFRAQRTNDSRENEAFSFLFLFTTGRPRPDTAPFSTVGWKKKAEIF